MRNQEVLTATSRPRFRSSAPGIGIVSGGDHIKDAQLKAYQKYSLNLVGVCDDRAEATDWTQKRFGVKYMFRDMDELLAHPEIAVVDVTSWPEQPVALIHALLEVGKHVLVSKPSASDIHSAEAILRHAQQRGLTVAVNHHGPWFPAWHIAPLLLEHKGLGDVLAVTHLHDTPIDWSSMLSTTNPRAEIIAASSQWIDITNCWLADKTIASVRAGNFCSSAQPMKATNPHDAWVEIGCTDGYTILIHRVGCSRTSSRSHPFWLHGTTGMLRGRMLGADGIEVEDEQGTYRYTLGGSWFPYSLAGAMNELICAISDGRQPCNSLAQHLTSLRIMLAACRSAEADGRLVRLNDV